MPLTSLSAVMLSLGLLGEVGPSLPERQLTLQELVSGMDSMDKARAESLRDYSSLRRYTLVNKRFKTTAEIRVRMTYGHPGTKSFEVISEQGPSIIRKSVLRRLIKTELDAARPEIRDSTRINQENYAFRLLGTEMEQGRRYYVLEAEPRRPSQLHFRGRIWVDPQDFAVVRIEGSPAQNASFWIRKTDFVHRFQKFGRFCLPVSNSSETDARIFGRTEVKVEYTDYRINEGKPPTDARRASEGFILESEELSANGPGVKPTNGKTGFNK